MMTRIFVLAWALLSLALNSTAVAEENKPQPTVAVEAKFLKVPTETVRKLLAEVTKSPAPTGLETLTSDQRSQFIEKLNQARSVQIIASPKIVTFLDQPAVIQIGSEVQVDQPQKRTEFVGLTMNVVVNANGELYTLALQTTQRQQVPNVAPAVFREQKIDTRLTVVPKQVGIVSANSSNDGVETFVLFSANPTE